MQRFADVVLDAFGNAVEGAEVAVLDSTGALAALFADDALPPTPLGNPLATDPRGTFSFYAAHGRYTLNVTGAGLPTRTVPDVLLQDPAALLTAADLLADWVATGLLPADPGASLSMITPTGVAYILGQRVSPIATAKTYTASRDTYVDLSARGLYTYSEVTNGAAAPAVAANSLRLFKVVTDATEITGVTDLRVVTIRFAQNVNFVYDLSTGKLSLTSDQGAPNISLSAITNAALIFFSGDGFLAKVVGGGAILQDSVTGDFVLTNRSGNRIILSADTGFTEHHFVIEENGNITLFKNLTWAPGASVTPTVNGQVTAELTNDTTLTFKAKGSDGVVRSGAVPLA